MAIDLSTYYSVSGAKGSKSTSSSSNPYSLDMTDFLQLLIAQLQNQDVMSPMDNSEFMNQMTQMSSIQAINSITSMVNSSYAASLVGKQVTVLDTGTNSLVTGTITGTGLYNGQQIVFINDKSYALSSIVAVGTLPSEKG